VSSALRKNTIAALGSAARAPDAILTCDAVSFENPAPGSSDHSTFEFKTEDGFEPIESTHACEPLTFRERAGVDGPTVTGKTVEEGDATSTFRRGGTVTNTVCVRLLKDGRWAGATREIIALPTTIASNERRNLTINRASSHRPH